MRVHPCIREQLHRFQTVQDGNWIRLVQLRREIAKERQSSHLRAMALHVFQSPSWVGGMSVIHSERRLNERMSATDTGIQKRNVAWIGIVSVGRTTRQFVDPLRLFGHWQAVEEIRCDGRSGKGAHAAQSADGLSELIAIGLCDYNGIFGKLQSIRSHCDAVVWCGRDEGFGHIRLEPNLPDGRNIHSGKFAWGAAPEGTQPRFRDGSDTLHKVRVLRTARDDFTIFFAIRRVFSPKLLDLLAQLFDTLGCRKHRRSLFSATGNWSIFDAKKHQAAGVQAVFFQTFVYSRADFQINARKFGCWNIRQRVDGLKQCLGVRRAIGDVTWSFGPAPALCLERARLSEIAKVEV